MREEIVPLPGCELVDGAAESTPQALEGPFAGLAE